MLAREFHPTRESALEAARMYAAQSGAEDVWQLPDGKWQSFPTSLRDLHKMIEPGAELVVESVGVGVGAE